MSKQTDDHDDYILPPSSTISTYVQWLKTELEEVARTTSHESLFDETCDALVLAIHLDASIDSSEDRSLTKLVRVTTLSRYRFLKIPLPADRIDRLKFVERVIDRWVTKQANRDRIITGRCLTALRSELTSLLSKLSNIRC